MVSFPWFNLFKLLDIGEEVWLVDCLTVDAILTGDVIFTHSWSSKVLMFLGLLLLVAASVASSGLFSASWIFFLLVSILLVDLLSPRSSTRIIISPFVSSCPSSCQTLGFLLLALLQLLWSIFWLVLAGVVVGLGGDLCSGILLLVEELWGSVVEVSSCSGLLVGAVWLTGWVVGLVLRWDL